MGQLVNLEAERILRNPHREGEARCLNCKHSWQAIAPVGTYRLECPSCHTTQGVFNGVSSTAHPQWQCQCGEWQFFIDLVGPYCIHCGTRPTCVRTPPPKGAA